MFSELTRVKDAQSNTREVFHQASEMVSIIGLYIDFHDAIQKGKITLLRLFLPYFAGSSSHRYTQGNCFISLGRSYDPDTWMYILDNTLVKAKGPHDFEKMSAHWSLVSGILDSARKALLISTSRQDKEVVSSRAAKSMAVDIFSLLTAIIDDGIISNPSKKSDVSTVGLYRKGIDTLHAFNMEEVYKDLFIRNILTSGAQEGEDPFVVDTDTVDVVGAHEDDEDLLDDILNEVDVEPEPTPFPFN
jgi:hypothetical protein